MVHPIFLFPAPSHPWHSQSGSPNLLLQNTLAAPITVTPTTLGPIASAEAGPYKFKVALSQQPSANVVMDLSVGEAGWCLTKCWGLGRARGQVGCTTDLRRDLQLTCWNASWNGWLPERAASSHPAHTRQPSRCRLEPRQPVPFVPQLHQERLAGGTDRHTDA